MSQDNNEVEKTWVVPKRPKGRKRIQADGFVCRTILTFPPIELEKANEVCKIKNISRAELIRDAINLLLADGIDNIHNKLFKVKGKSEYVKSKLICVCFSKSHFDTINDVKNIGVPSERKTLKFKKLRFCKERATFSQFILDALQNYYTKGEIHFEYN